MIRDPTVVAASMVFPFAQNLIIGLPKTTVMDIKTKFSNIWDAISRTGSEHCEDFNARKRLRLTNQLAFIFGGFATFYFFLFAALSMIQLAAIIAAVIVGYAGVIFLSRVGYISGAKILFVSVINMGVLIFSIQLGVEAGSHFFYFVTLTLPYLIFNNDEKTFKYLLVAQPLVLLLIVPFYSTLFPGLHQAVPVEVSHSLYFTVASGAFAFAVVPLSLFSREEDIRLELESRVKEQTDEINKALEAKRHLIRVMSHDISSPLTVIKNASELIVESTDLETAVMLGQKVDKASDQIGSLIDDIRNMEAIDSDANYFSVEPIAVQAVIDEIGFLFKDRLKAKNVTLDVQTNSLEGQYINVHKNSFVMQVMGNILSNALKFSRTGDTILLSVFAKDLDMICWKVEDKGIGIPETIFPKLFDPHEATSRVGTGGEKGTGFGMPILKRCVESFGGTVEIESRDIKTNPDNHGTIVSITVKKSAWLKTG